MAARPITEITAGRENGRRRPRGYAEWRPQAKTRVLLEQVSEVLEEYANQLPLTVRQVFYRLVAIYGYDKTELAYNRLAEHLVRARRARLIPFDYIRDDGIVTYSPDWHEDVESFWNDTARRIKTYARDRQAGQDYRVELWCEAAGMAPQLARVASEFSVPVFSSGGFSSLSAVRTIVDRASDRNVSTVLLHVGDFDPSGESIFESMTADAAAFLEQDKMLARLVLHPIRIALDFHQVDQYDLPTAPPKPTDSRTSAWRGETCQLEALAPDVLAEIVHTSIQYWFDEDVLDEQLAAEDLDKVELWRGLPRGSE
jgi:hypothetical protein